MRKIKVDAGKAINKSLLAGLLVMLSLFFLVSGCGKDKKTQAPGLAVEYNTHAACAFIAQEKGWLPRPERGRGLFSVYATGVALSGALARGDVDAAFICLIPAVTAYTNGGVPVKIVCGTHQYGYGLVCNASRIKEVRDLEESGIKIGCVSEGGTTDILLHKIIEKHALVKEKVMRNVLRMDPPRQLLALKAGEIDAAVVPEHFATLAEELGFKMLLKSQDVWPEMPGSVLLATDRLVTENRAAVKELYAAVTRATAYINENPAGAAEIVAQKLNDLQGPAGLSKTAGAGGDFYTTAETMRRSMDRLTYTTRLEKEKVQEVIDFMHKLGYIKEAFPAEKIMLEEGWAG
ncbi:MAG: ABC transporter substrate-binding protein [Peptococcaceae bacterium]|jgi:NitT/TauT family transport system substrate-binding protein|nr:ABC transporter substrate-binding protein [Peptococcaceae bacterium]MDH7524594.1 ABC transporter substrate-binding protein [Peptococcaceae bacterium]